MYKVRFGVALVGRAGAGKSVIRRLLAEGSTWLRCEELSQVGDVTVGDDLRRVHRYASFAMSLLCVSRALPLFRLILRICCMR